VLERGHLRCEERVAAGLGLCEEEERGEAGRLELVGYVGVPDGRRDGVVELIVEGRIQIPKEVL
jgi:hypothetical protein